MVRDSRQPASGIRNEGGQTPERHFHGFCEPVRRSLALANGPVKKGDHALAHPEIGWVKNAVYDSSAACGAAAGEDSSPRAERVS